MIKMGHRKGNVNETEKNRTTKNSDLNKKNADMGSESITCTYMPEQIFITISYEENAEEKLQISCIPSLPGRWLDGLRCSNYNSECKALESGASLFIRSGNPGGRRPCEKLFRNADVFGRTG